MNKKRSTGLARAKRLLGYTLKDIRQDGIRARRVPVSAFWWDMHPNFGDEFTPFLLPRYGFMPLLRPPSTASFFGTGSIIDMSPNDTRAVFWGSGKMHEDRDSSRPSATVLALRGHLTREAMGIADRVSLGDPGLLAQRWLPRSRNNGTVGVILHFSHAEHDFARRLQSDLAGEALFIDPTEPLPNVVAAISSCTAVVTTSLHGLVVADSYGIPAAWALPEPVLPGGSFKFRDYESVVEPARERQVTIADITSASAVVAASAGVSRTAVAHAADSLEQSLLTYGTQFRTSVHAGTRPWHQYRYLLG